MIDVRLKELPFEWEGKTYMLRCNFNVLADLQEEFGEIPNILDGNKSLKVYSAVVAFMLNDYADSMGWKERFTPKGIGRKIDLRNLPSEKIQEVFSLLLSALYVPKEEMDEQPKN